MPHLSIAKASEIGLDQGRIDTAYNLLREWTTGPNATVPGGAIVVGRNGKIVEPKFFGKQGAEPSAVDIRRVNEAESAQAALAGRL